MSGGEHAYYDKVHNPTFAFNIDVFLYLKYIYYKFCCKYLSSVLLSAVQAFVFIACSLLPLLKCGFFLYLCGAFEGCLL